jgi:hypothetical protein
VLRIGFQGLVTKILKNLTSSGSGSHEDIVMEMLEPKVVSVHVCVLQQQQQQQQPADGPIDHEMLSGAQAAIRQGNEENVGWVGGWIFFAEVMLLRVKAIL